MVAPVEQQNAAGQEERERGRGWSQWGRGAALSGGLTVLAVAVNGYHPYAEDGGLYAAGVKRLLDPALYPHETAFVLAPMRFSEFARVVAGTVRVSHAGLPAVLLAVHLATVWATLYAAWLLAQRCWAGNDSGREHSRAARVGAVALTACWLGLPVAGTALAMMDPYVTARSFSTPAMVLALVGALDMTEWGTERGARRRGALLWAASIALAAAMHPLMAAYALGATLMLMCVRLQSRWMRVWGTAGLSAAAVVLAAGVQWFARPESAEYVRVALTRTYWYPAAWRWYELVGLGAPLGILGVVGWWGGTRSRISEASIATRSASLGPSHISEARCATPASRGRSPGTPHGAPNAVEALARMGVVVGATAWVVAEVFAREGGATHLVARMQPLRAFQIVYLAMLLVLGAWLGGRVLRRSAWRWIAAAAVLGGGMLGAQRMAFRHSEQIEAPGTAARNGWVRGFEWIRANTPKDALFALDADYINATGEDAQCFRAIAERSALADYSKDGGEASIAPELAGAWARGQAAQQGLSAAGETDEERLATLGPLGVTWVVLRAGARTGLECPYANDEVRVCRVR